MITKQNTARTIAFGPVLDVAGLPYTGAIAYTDAKIYKNGVETALDLSATFTHKNQGMYALALTANDLDTLGSAEIALNLSGYAAAPVRLDVVPANVYDSLVAGTDALDVSLIQWLGTAPLALASQQVQAVVPATQQVDVATIKAVDADTWKTNLLAALEADLIDDETHEAVLAAIVAKLEASFPDLDTLTLSAIASQVRTELATELARIDVAISTRHAAGAAVAKSPATLDWANDVSNKPTIGTSTLDAAGVRAAVGLADANLDEQIAALPTTSSIASAVWGYATRTLTSLSSLVASIATAVWSAPGRALSSTSGANAPSASTSDADIYVTAFKGGTARLCARVYLDGADIQRADVSSIAYSIYLLDDQDPDSRTAVTGHSAVSLTINDVIFDELQTDAQASDYNFRHTPPISTNPAFAIAGRNYLVEYTITPTSGEKVLVRFRVEVL